MIKNLASTLLIGAFALYFPIISHVTPVLSGCIIPAWGCTQNENEQVELYEDGSGTLNNTPACFIVTWGCTPDAGQHVEMFEDGSVRITTR